MLNIYSTLKNFTGEYKYSPVKANFEVLKKAIRDSKDRILQKTLVERARQEGLI